MAARASTLSLRSGLRLSYAEQGDASEPALLLLPGPTDSWRSYQPVLDLLPSTIRAIALTPRGHGDSDKPVAGYRVADFAADVPEVLDAVDLEQAVLVGHSGSCLVARRVALDHPGRVAGLVLEASPTTLRNDPQLEELVASVISRLTDPVDPGFARSFVVDTSSEALAPELQDTLVAEVLKVPARVWQQTFAGLQEHDDVEELGQVTAPTLLIWGDADGLISAEVQEELLRRLPSASLIVHAGAGHTPRWDDPKRFASDVAGFVRRLSGR